MNNHSFLKYIQMDEQSLGNEINDLVLLYDLMFAPPNSKNVTLKSIIRNNNLNIDMYKVDTSDKTEEKRLEALKIFKPEVGRNISRYLHKYFPTGLPQRMLEIRYTFTKNPSENQKFTKIFTLLISSDYSEFQLVKIVDELNKSFDYGAVLPISFTSS